MTQLEETNNQYLSCVTTLNPHTKEFLKNKKGTIIIEGKPDSNNELKEIYLGDIFLAAGYGVNNKKDKETLDTIVEYYSQNIKDLNDKDTNLANGLNNIKDKFDELKNSIYEKLNDYLRENANIFHYFQQILTYKSPVINSINYTIKVENNNVPYVDQFDIPIGSIIENVDINIKGKLNDINRINSVKIILHTNEYINIPEVRYESDQSFIINIRIRFTDQDKIRIPDQLELFKLLEIEFENPFISGNEINNYLYNVLQDHPDIQAQLVNSFDELINSQNVNSISILSPKINPSDTIYIYNGNNTGYENIHSYKNGETPKYNIIDLTKYNSYNEQIYFVLPDVYVLDDIIGVEPNESSEISFLSFCYKHKDFPIYTIKIGEGIDVGALSYLKLQIRDNRTNDDINNYNYYGDYVDLINELSSHFTVNELNKYIRLKGSNISYFYSWSDNYAKDMIRITD